MFVDGSGFSERFKAWASPHSPWAGPRPQAGVCNHRCNWTWDGYAADYIVHPAFDFGPPGFGRASSLLEVRSATP